MKGAHWTKEIKERDGSMCRRCGFGKNLHAHHILPKKKYRRVGSRTKYNGITLCGNCHVLLKGKETETNLRGFLPYDIKIDNQLKSLLKWVEIRRINISDQIKKNLAGDEKEYNDLVELYFERAQKSMELKMYKQTIVHCDEAIRYKSNYSEAYFLRGRAKAQQRHYTAAISDFDKALNIRPNHVNGYIWRGIAKQHNRDYTGAIADYDMVIKLSLDAHAWIWYMKGKVQYIIGDYKTAIVDYDEAIQRGYDGADVYRERGRAKSELGQYEASVDDFLSAITDLKLDNAETVEIYRLLADAYCGAGYWDAALSCLDDAIELKDNDPTLYVYRADLNDTLRQYENAIDDYDTAINLNPNNADVYLSRGLIKYVIYYEQDRENEAFADFETAFGMKPELRFEDCIEKSILNDFLRWKKQKGQSKS